MNSATKTLPLASMPSTWPGSAPLRNYWLLFCVSLLTYIANYCLASIWPVLVLPLSVISCVGCGLSWLLARSLFRETTGQIWPRVLVAILFVFSAQLVVVEYLWVPARNSVYSAFVGRLVGLISSTVLLLPLIEAAEGLRQLVDKKERRFRLIFLAGYGSFLACALLVSIAALAPIASGAKTLLALCALCAATLAVHYRAGHPLPAGLIQKQRKRPVESDPLMAAKLSQLMQTQQVYLDPELKVSTLAQQLQEQEYKVTALITGALGYRNFNHMVNYYRIEHAKKLLTAAESADTSILAIAMDCGFSSIGPFNRAFKELAGSTPSEFRKNHSNLR